MVDSVAKFKAELVRLVPRLRRFAVVLAQSPATADDLVQSTVERALSRYNQWQVGTKMDSWVFSILHSIWVNDLRAQKIRQGHGFVDVDSLRDERSSNRTERTILLDQVFTYVNDLPEAQREAIVLVYVEGYGYEEAAEILDIPSGTLMSRLARARASLARNVATCDLEQVISHSRP